MGSYALEVQLLRPVSRRYKSNPDKIWPEIPSELAQAYGPEPPDDTWHVRLKTISRYCSMDELKQYIAMTRPGFDLSASWSMTGGIDNFSDVLVSAGGKSLRIPAGEYDALKSDHVISNWYAVRDAEWAMDNLYGDYDWLKPFLPGYIRAETLQALLRARIGHAAADENNAIDRLDNEYGRHDILGFLADAYALAKTRKCALWACLSD